MLRKEKHAENMPTEASAQVLKVITVKLNIQIKFQLYHHVPCNKSFKTRSHMDILSVGVSDRGVLNQPVNLNCVFPIPDGDAKRHKAYTGSGNSGPTSSLGDQSCIPCTEMLIIGGYKLGERGS